MDSRRRDGAVPDAGEQRRRSAPPRGARSLSASEAQRGPRVERRTSRPALSRIEILDVAGTVFGGDGTRHDCRRKIAASSGFSTAAFDCFFEDRQHLLIETLKGRAEELDQELQSAMTVMHRRSTSFVG